MNYTIAQVSKMTNLTTHTIRFYDKEGLLPFVNRTSSGNRTFSESDIEWLTLICCLKDTGMQIKDIKKFVDWCIEGDSSLEKRRQLFLKQRAIVEQQMNDMQKHLDTIDHKIAFYNNACTATVHDMYKK